MHRIGYLFNERSTRVSDKDYPPLSVSKKGIVPQLESIAVTNNNNNRKLVRVGDFVINSRSDRRGSCGGSLYDGSVTPISIVLIPHDSIYNKYYHYLFRSSIFANEFYKWGTGIVDDLWSTKWDAMRKIPVPLPPLPQQESIARYLDCKVSLIDRILVSTDKILLELSRYHKTIVQEAVTGHIKVP